MKLLLLLALVSGVERCVSLNVGVPLDGSLNGLLAPGDVAVSGETGAAYVSEFAGLYSAPREAIAKQLNLTEQKFAMARKMAAEMPGHAMKMGCGNITGCQTSEDLDMANLRMGNGMAVKFTGDVQVDFVRSMIAHHAGAVDMCYVLLNTAPEPALSYLCSEIVFHQTTEIRLMSAWLEAQGHAAAACGTNGTNMDCVPECKEDSENAAVMTMHDHKMVMGCGVTGASNPAAGDFITYAAKMHGGMSIDFSCDVVKDFLRSMIPHHSGAVDMCSVLKQYTSESTIDPFLRALCNEIGFAQRGEVAWQTYYLEAHDYEPAVCGTPPTFTTGRCMSECDAHAGHGSHGDMTATTTKAMDHSGHGDMTATTTKAMDHSGHGDMTATTTKAMDPAAAKYHAMSHAELVAEAMRLEAWAKSAIAQRDSSVKQAADCEVKTECAQTSGPGSAKKGPATRVETGVALAIGAIVGAAVRW